MSQTASQPLNPGVLLGGRYEIIEAADYAAFGTLYKAKRREDGVIVTVEVLDTRLFGEPRVRSAVRHEIEGLRGLDHKNLAVPIDLGDEMLPSGTITWLVYEHLDGQSLLDMNERKRAQGKPFSLKGAYNVVAHITNGLIALSERGFHGALSLRSVHVTSSGRVKILELGLARALLSSGVRTVLTQAVPGIAPEARTQPDSVDGRADVFAVGSIFYELLTGQAPASPPVPPSTFVAGLPRGLDIFLDQCLRAAPSERFAEMSRVKESLQQAVGADTGAASSAASAAAAPPKAAPVLSSAPPPQAAAPPPRPAPPPARPAPPPGPPRAALHPPGLAPPGLAPPSRSAPSMQAAVPRSFNVDSALSTTDESHERWLIQKDKLDFGPFNLRDVKAQIEGGEDPR